MLLESSILLINIFCKNIFLLTGLTLFLLIINFKSDSGFFIKIKKVAKFMLIYLFYCIISLFFYKTGRVLLTFGKIYITYEGLFVNLIKLVSLYNLFLLSFYVSAKIKKKKYRIDVKHKKIEKLKNYYEDVFRLVFENVPYILDLIKKKVNFSDSYKKILQKVYRNL